MKNDFLILLLFVMAVSLKMMAQSTLRNLSKHRRINEVIVLVCERKFEELITEPLLILCFMRMNDFQTHTLQVKANYQNSVRQNVSKISDPSFSS